MDEKVLFVDDMEVNRLLLENMLEELPVDCDCAENADEALRLLGENTYKICFFDHRMPGKDGVELLNELRAMEDNPNQHCPCYVLTGDDRPDGEEYYTSLGFDGFLPNPPDKAVLTDLVWKYIEAEDSVRKELPDAEKEIMRVPEEIRESRLLSCEDGIKKCGSAGAYIDALNIFLESVEENANELEEAYKAKDVKRYNIKAHGLKSTARLIGANEFADKAAALEENCDAGLYDFVRDNHEDFLVEYRRFLRFESTIKETIQTRSMQNVLLIAPQESFSIHGARTKLLESGINGMYVQNNAADLKIHYRFARLFVYFTDGEVSTRTGFHNYLRKICEEEGKKMILVGSRSEYGDVVKVIPRTAIYEHVERPCEMATLVNEVSGFFNGREPDSEDKKRILIVDDDVAYMRVIENWLRNDYRVSMASSGIEAMKQLAENPADLLLLDYEMPVMDGPSFAAVLKKYSNTRDIPVIFLTGKKDRESVMKAIGVRPVGYVLKTTDRADLLDKMKKYFAGSPR